MGLWSGGDEGYEPIDDEGLARARASATMATMARLTSSPVEQGWGKPNRTAARPVGPSATISNP